MRAIVPHTAVGTLSSIDATFLSAASQVSAHYAFGLQGEAHQYVALSDAAWANGILEPGNLWEGLFGSGNPNNRTISFESEDNGQPDSQPVTDEQYEVARQTCQEIIIPTWPSITHLLGHHSISPQSRSCPASRWYNSGRFDQLAADLGLIAVKGP